MRSEVASVGDAPAVAEVVNAAYRGIGGRRGWTHEGALLSGERAAAEAIAELI